MALGLGIRSRGQYTFYTFFGWRGAFVEFDFDEKKSETNKAKHGIDFVEAQARWLDERRVEIPARSGPADFGSPISCRGGCDL
jgi:hypothetical protein